MARSTFKTDERDIEFALFEHLDFEGLTSLSRFDDVSIDICRDMLSAAKTFSEEVFAPLNIVGDREGCHYDKETLKVTAPKGFKEAYRQYCEAGYMALTADPEHGGLGLPFVVGAAISEMTTAANLSLMMYCALTRGACNLLEAFGVEWIRNVCLPKMLAGDWAGTMCLTEPSVGTAVGDLITKAIPDGDHYRIDGVKQWISSGEHDLCENIIHLVLARVEGAPAGIKGVSLFMVPRQRFDHETGELLGDNDVKCIGIEEKLGIHGNSTCLMRFGDEGKCIGYLIGEENQGITYMFKMMNEARIGVGVQGLSLASVAFLNAEAYAGDRVQGTDIESFKDANAPRVSIIHHPDVRRMLMRQRAISEGARALIYHTAFYADMASFHPDKEKQALCHGYVELLTPIVKAWCTDLGFDVTVNALQTLGGYGYTRDYPIEQYLRDLKVGSIYEGTNGVQALDLIGRKMKMKRGKLFMDWIARINGFFEENQGHFVLSEALDACAAVKDLLVEAAMHLGALGMEGRQREAVLNATPFMLAFGHVTVAQLLLEQAVTAANKMSDASDADARFYRNKIRTARFFVFNILPEARAWLEIVKKTDPSALEFEFSEDL